MGTHPIFESDFDCLTELFDMDEIYNEFYQKVEELHDLLKFGEDMYTYESRLKSFEDSNWPFSAPDKCCPENLAAAGFFFYPASSSSDSVFDFVIFKEISGWESDEDPMAEQLKRKKGHPLFSRRWAPKKHHLTDALSLPDDKITSLLFFKISALAEEGSFQKRIDDLSELFEETKRKLLDQISTERATSTDLSFNVTIQENVDLKFERFKTEVENLIKEYESTLSDLKKEYTRRFKGGSFNPEGSPNAEAWTQMLDKPFKESLLKIMRNQRTELAEDPEKENRRISSFVTNKSTVQGGPPSAKKNATLGRSTRKNISRSMRSDISTGSVLF